MNMLIRSQGLLHPPSDAWHGVPHSEDTWVYELNSEDALSLKSELLKIRESLQAISDLGAELVLHIGKYDETSAVTMDLELMSLVKSCKLSLEIY